MRFAIALLTVICIASVIGTVVQQHQPANNYVNQFGPFWADVFETAGLYTVYSVWWFLVILAFLVTSTSLCIARNTPKILTDFKAFKEDIREKSLQAFGHKAQAEQQDLPEAAAHRMGQALLDKGWRVKLQTRALDDGQTGWMLAAKTGAANKVGYLAAHGAIVLICLGGLLDGDLIVRAQTWFNGKEVFTGSGLIADVPEASRLTPSNPTFRGNLKVSEGTSSSAAILAQPDGVLIQDLPFTIELKKFIVDYYSTGMPKLFASDIVIHDHETGEKKEARVEVNHPASHRGINIYQSSFEDGGSKVTMKAFPMNGPTRPFEVTGNIGGSTSLSRGDDKLTLEFTGLRVINVENMANTGGAGGSTDVRAVDLRQELESRLGAGHKSSQGKTLRNVGPSIEYKLRDPAGQAIEYHNYMLPVQIDGDALFLLGMREAPSEPFRYLRVPADEKGEMDGFVRLRAALADPSMREEAVKRYAVGAVEQGRDDLVKALSDSALRALNLFAGSEEAPVPKSAAPGTPPPPGGLVAVSSFLETNVPAGDLENASSVLVRILQGTLFELYQLSRADAGLAPAQEDAATQRFMSLAVVALSDAFFYPAPMTFQLSEFEQVQASVFQVARAPGQNIVYLGCVLLIIGVFAMLYVRERRIWIWVIPHGDKNSHATMALSANRKTIDGDREFSQLKNELLRMTS
ncbi:cytochrome c biogenesis protein ResB [Hydrogenophaga sp. 5NK40-0174]